MSLTQTIWKAAYAAFGKEVYKAWPQLCERWEHALWVWNDAYGPLCPAQREFAAERIVSALKWAADHPADQRYARFNASLSHWLNHERTQAGFKSREEREEPVAFLSSLADQLAEVAA